MAAELLTLLATALGTTEADLTAALVAVTGTAPEVAPGMKVATCKATARSTGKRCTKVPAEGEVVCHLHGANKAPAKVTQVVSRTETAKVTVGFRAKGALARRSAYVVAEALGLDAKSHTTRASLLAMSREEVGALLAERGYEMHEVPASQLG